MIHANKGWSILEYEQGDDYLPTQSGILVMTARAQRMSTKGKTKIIGKDPDTELPDVIRFGIFVSGERYLPGVTVIFNKHDAFGFTIDDTYYYAIRNEHIIGALEEK